MNQTIVSAWNSKVDIDERELDLIMKGSGNETLCNFAERRKNSVVEKMLLIEKEGKMVLSDGRKLFLDDLAYDYSDLCSKVDFMNDHASYALDDAIDAFRKAAKGLLAYAVLDHVDIAPEQADDFGYNDTLTIDNLPHYLEEIDDNYLRELFTEIGYDLWKENIDLCFDQNGTLMPEHCKECIMGLLEQAKDFAEQKEKEMIDIGTFSVDVQLQEDGKFDVYIAHEGSSGSHYFDVSADDIGRLVAEDIECFAEGYQNEFGKNDERDL